MKTWRLVSGIVSMILCTFVLFQSCSVGLYNTVAETNKSSGSAGAIVAIMMLCGGIVSCVKRYGGSNKAIVALYGVGAFFGFTLADAVYKDLFIWAFWCMVCSIMAMVADVIDINREYPVDEIPYDQPVGPYRRQAPNQGQQYGQRQQRGPVQYNAQQQAQRRRPPQQSYGQPQQPQRRAHQGYGQQYDSQGFSQRQQRPQQRPVQRPQQRPQQRPMLPDRPAQRQAIPLQGEFGQDAEPITFNEEDLFRDDDLFK